MGDMEMENEEVAGENVCSTKRQNKLQTERPGEKPENGQGVEREHCILRRYKSRCRVRASASGGRDTVQDRGIKYQWGNFAVENTDGSVILAGTGY
jgi:hypothetical protein